MLVHMAHRGGTGCEPSSGDGAGIMLGLPHAFYARVLKQESNLTLPPAGEYGTGLIFLPQKAEAQAETKKLLAASLTSKGFKVYNAFSIDFSHSDHSTLRFWRGVLSQPITPLLAQSQREESL